MDEDSRSVIDDSCSDLEESWAAEDVVFEDLEEDEEVEEKEAKSLGVPPPPPLRHRLQHRPHNTLNLQPVLMKKTRLQLQQAISIARRPTTPLIAPPPPPPLM